MFLIRREAPSEFALRYQYGDDHSQELAEGLDLVDVELAPAHLLVDVGAAFGHAGDVIVARGGLRPGGRRLAIDHHTAFADAAAARGATFGDVSILADTPVHAGQHITIVCSHVANQAVCEKSALALDADLLRVHDFGLAAVVAGALVTWVELEPGHSPLWRELGRRAAGWVSHLRPEAVVARRCRTVRPANATRPEGIRKTFALELWRDPAELVCPRWTPRDLAERSVILDDGWGQIDQAEISADWFYLMRNALPPDTPGFAGAWLLDLAEAERVANHLQHRADQIAAAQTMNAEILGATPW